jgi:transposase-like protein
MPDVENPDNAMDTVQPTATATVQDVANAVANRGLPPAPTVNGIHPNNPMSPRRITAAERRRQAMEYKVLGASLSQIAAKLGITKQRVHTIVAQELKKESEQTRLAAEQYRQLELNQLEKMEFGIMQQASTGDVFAIDRMIKIHQQRATLIPGLSVPQKHEVGGMSDDEGNPAGVPIQIVLSQDEAQA